MCLECSIFEPLALYGGFSLFRPLGFGTKHWLLDFWFGRGLPGFDLPFVQSYVVHI